MTTEFKKFCREQIKRAAHTRTYMRANPRTQAQNNANKNGAEIGVYVYGGGLFVCVCAHVGGQILDGSRDGTMLKKL